MFCRSTCNIMGGVLIIVEALKIENLDLSSDSFFLSSYSSSSPLDVNGVMSTGIVYIQYCIL